MIPLLDLAVQYRTIDAEIDEAISRVLERGQFILGPEVETLEQDVAKYLGVKHGVGVASGTDAIFLALRALDVGPGDEVILPAYTFFATAGAVLMVGATPVFVDIDPVTYCLDVGKASDRITEKTKAIIPVHLYGHPADMSGVLALGREHNIKVIEDAAQAFGASYNGQKAGGIGDVGCLSFFPSKNLGGYGDGGMVVSNDTRVVERLLMMRTHGWKKKYYPLELGYNSRLDTLQAAILSVKLRYLDQWNRRRRELAHCYVERLSDSRIGLPQEVSPGRHVYHLFTLRLENRDLVQRVLMDHGVATGIYYPLPLHLTEPFKSGGDGIGSFPIAEKASRETLAIPLYPELSDAQLDTVINALKEALRR